MADNTQREQRAAELAAQEAQNQQNAQAPSPASSGGTGWVVNDPTPAPAPTPSQPTPSNPTPSAPAPIALINPATGATEVYTPTSNPNIGIDAGGNLVYIGGYLPGGYTPQNTQAIESNAPIISTTAEYTGQASALGGTWGQTPATLAQEAFAGGQIGYTVTNADGSSREATKAEAKEILQQAIAGMSSQQQAQYKTALAILESAPGATPEEKLAYVQQQTSAEALALPVSQRNIQDQSVIGKQEQAIIKTASEPAANIIKLKTEEYIDRSAFDSLKPEYQKVLMNDGIEALNTRLDRDEKKAGEDRAAEIQDTKSKIAGLEAKQSNYEAQSLWAKAATVLGSNVSFEEVVQEALTFGGAKTKTFDSDTIEKEYQQSRLNALEAGQNMPISSEEYKQQVLSKQTTAAELGMQLVPFEYAREGRFDQLQLWEKVVYPVLDIVSLIPVVGWAGKGISAGAKTGSMAARIAALGGKQAVEFAAKDAVLAVEKATAQKLAKEGLLAAVKEGAKSATDNVTKKVLQKAIKPAMKDVQMATKEYNQIVKGANELAKMSEAVAKTETKGAAVYRAATRTEEIVGKAGKYTEPVDVVGSSGVVGYSTVANWNDLTPEQRTGGLALAALSSGIGGKALNLAENIIDPYKIPIAALKPRAARTEVEAGKIFSSTKGGIAGTTRLVLDHTMKPEDARVTVASLMKQLTEGKDAAKATIKTTLGEKEIKVKGTGLQKTVGQTSISASPMGEIFKEGTGAGGAKTNLEKYLRDANAAKKTAIEIETKPITVNGEEMVVKTISAPGVTVKGSEGGMYLGAAFYNQFSHKAAFGASGKISSGLLVTTPGISELPKSIRNTKDIAKMQEKAMKEFDGAKYVNQEVEGFKQYAKFMEFENVITNGSQLQRSQNLRSKLADTLRGNKGEYYTRDPKGRIELFQMYMEGGRATPYTMKELYALKGNALKNSLEDLFFGLEKKIDDLKEGKLISTKENVVTKEAQVSKAFNDIDVAVQRKGLTEIEAKRLKNEILAEYRSRIEYAPKREILRQEITRLATRSEMKRKDDLRRDQRYVDQVRADRARERQQIISRTPIRENARSPINDRSAAREGTRERQEPRSSVRETARQPRREAVRETPREIGRNTPRETPRSAARNVLRETPRETPRNVPRIAPPRTGLRNVPTIPRQAIIFIQDHSEHKNLDPKRFEGAIAWRQGLFYQIRWQPFGKEDVFYSQEPIPGVKYHEGLGSAAKSAVALYGEVPQNVRLDMGIVDINITRGRDVRKPILGFKADSKQKTHYSGINKDTGSIKKSK
jgi:hypothetical protein